MSCWFQRVNVMQVDAEMDVKSKDVPRQERVKEGELETTCHTSDVFKAGPPS